MCSKWVIYINDADAPQQKTISESIGGYIFLRLPQIFWRFFCGVYCTYVRVRVRMRMRVRVHMRVHMRVRVRVFNHL